MTHQSADTKWTWRAVGPQPPAKVPMKPGTKAALIATFMIALGVFLRWKFHHVIGPAILWTLAGVNLVGGFLYPPIFHAMERFGQKLAKWVSTGLTWGLLAPFYYICFVPGRFFSRLSGKDPLTREFPTKLPTYWIPRPPVRSMNQYKKQH